MERTCVVPNCKSARRSGELCNAHGHRLRRYGHPCGAPPPRPSRSCALTGCDLRVYGRGWCRRHWLFNRNHGTPHWAPVAEMALAERVRHFALPAARDDCWPWTGNVDKDGYGALPFEGRNYRPHRLAWQDANGSLIPEGIVVRHTCDNPPCCNPAHLILGTQADNIGDAVRRGRWVHGESHGRMKLTTVQVDAIRLALAGGAGPTALGRKYGVSKTQIARIRDDVSRLNG